MSPIYGFSFLRYQPTNGFAFAVLSRVTNYVKFLANFRFTKNRDFFQFLHDLFRLDVYDRVRVIFTLLVVVGVGNHVNEL